MSSLHDTLEAGGYSGHQLERFLVRVLFCLFAEDTGILTARHSGFISSTAPPKTAPTSASTSRVFSTI